MNKIFRINLVTSFETTISRTGLALKFSHVNITLIDYAIAMIFKKKISVIQYFYVQNLFWTLCLQFRIVRFKSLIFWVSLVIFPFLSPPYLLEITIMVCKEYHKIEDFHYVSLASIIESMPKILIFLCEIWVLTPSFFGTPLRSHYQIFSPQIKQDNWLTHCSMKIQNYLRDK